MKKIVVVMLVFALLGAFSYAQDAVPDDAALDMVFSEGQVVSAVLLSSAAQLGTVVESLWYGEAWYPWAFMGTMTAQNVPALFFGSSKAVANMIAQIGLDGLFADRKSVV